MTVSSQFILLLIFSFVAGSLAYSFSGDWARRLQRKYIENAKHLHLDHTRWEGSFVLNMFKVGLVFLGVIVGGLVFSTIFGPIGL